MKGNTSTCYSFFLQKLEDTELTLHTLHDDYEDLKILAAVGKVEKVAIVGEVHVFKKEGLAIACEDKVPCALKMFI